MKIFSGSKKDLEKCTTTGFLDKIRKSPKFKAIAAGILAGTILLGSADFTHAKNFNSNDFPQQTIEHQNTDANKKQELININIEARNQGFKILHIYSEKETKALYEDIANMLSSEYGNILSKEELIKRLNNPGKVILISDNTLAPRGICMYGSNNIYVQQHEKPQNGKATPVLVHEALHKIAGLDSNFFDRYGGLTEAAVQGIVVNLFLKGKFNKIANANRDTIFDRDPYRGQMIIINQMSGLLNDDTLLQKFALNGDTTFIDNFVKQNGESLFLRLNETMNSWTIKNNYKDNDISDVQNALLKEVFDQRIQTVHDDKSSIEYLNQLSNFLTNTIRFYMNNATNNPDFEYYKGKLSDINQFFAENLYDNSKLKPLAFGNQELEGILSQHKIFNSPSTNVLNGNTPTVTNDFRDSIKVDNSTMAKIHAVENQASEPAQNKQIVQTEKENNNDDFQR
ncbi:MAG: hypothetical protein FWF46_06525 [Oscillospiraceae bacterium]|nr:hypothetical protein [Oscillospiraceae bacterium]